MTLSTHVQLLDHSEAELQELFLVMRDIAGIPPEWPWEVSCFDGWIHEPGCESANARVDMWRRDGNYWPTDAVRWDTPYAWRSETDETCTELHARFLVELGQRRPQWRERLRWCDESTGAWFDMDTDPFPVLCERVS